MISKIDRVRLTREQDRRAKLTEEEVAEARRLYAAGESKAKIARTFHVSPSCVDCLVDEEARRRKLEYMREYGKRRPKKDTAVRTAYMRDLRAYKRLLQSQEIKEDHT